MNDVEKNYKKCKNCGKLFHIKEFIKEFLSYNNEGGGKYCKHCLKHNFVECFNKAFESEFKDLI
jgi:hypothetical protein